MARKVKFPLEMDDGIMVRDLEGLRANFSVPRVLGYLANGKLVVWLRDRGGSEMADSIEELQICDPQFVQKICEILGVAYVTDISTPPTNMVEIAERNRKISLLKQYTMEQKYIDNVARVAFDQSDLDILINTNERDIYLCGETFLISGAVQGKKYVGINHPKVVIDSDKLIDFELHDIHFDNVEFDEKYNDMLQKSDSIRSQKKTGYKERVEEVHLASRLYTEVENVASNSNAQDQNPQLSCEYVSSIDLRSFLTYEMGKIKGRLTSEENTLYEFLLQADLISIGNKYFEK